jgi:hypothetical protein
MKWTRELEIYGMAILLSCGLAGVSGAEVEVNEREEEEVSQTGSPADDGVLATEATASDASLAGGSIAYGKEPVEPADAWSATEPAGVDAAEAPMAYESDSIDQLTAYWTALFGGEATVAAPGILVWPTEMLIASGLLPPDEESLGSVDPTAADTSQDLQLDPEYALLAEGSGSDPVFDPGDEGKPDPEPYQICCQDQGVCTTYWYTEECPEGSEEVECPCDTYGGGGGGT